MRTFSVGNYWKRMGTLGLAVLMIGCGKDGGAKVDEIPSTPLTGEPTKVVAKVGDDPITLAEVNRVVQSLRTGRFGDIDPQSPEPVLQKRALDNLIDQKLLFTAAEEKGAAPADAELDQAMQQFKSSRFPNEQAFQHMLTQQNVTEADFRQGFRADLAIRRFVQQSFMDTVKVTPEQARSYYDTHVQEFARSGRVRARHILVRAPQDAAADAEAAAMDRTRTILARVKGGEDFAKVATETSEDTGSGQRGGDLGFFERGAMVMPFDSVAFALAPGQISDVVRTQFGFHIIKVEEREDPGTAPFEEVAQMLSMKLQQDRASAHVEEYLAGLRKKAKIKRDI